MLQNQGNMPWCHHGREGQPRGREEGARRARGNSAIPPGRGQVQQV